jgi:uncharacterized protein YbjQ (UPF0145 family)
MDFSAIQKKTGVFLMTCERAEGYRVSNHLGLVAGNTVYGANFVKDFLARVHDTIGGRVSGYEKATGDALQKALEEMAKSAKELGANAVVGVRFTTNVVGGKGLMTASVIGTAVELQQN